MIQSQFLLQLLVILLDLPATLREPYQSSQCIAGGQIAKEVLGRGPRPSQNCPTISPLREVQLKPKTLTSFDVNPDVVILSRSGEIGDESQANDLSKTSAVEILGAILQS
jgi:hypothetical protein